MKTDEHERLSIKFEDMVTGMRHTKAENEMLKDTDSLLKFIEEPKSINLRANFYLICRKGIYKILFYRIGCF